MVTVTGSGFTGATSVSFGATPATSFTVVSDSQLTAVAPPGTGSADVTVTSIGGTSATSGADQFAWAPVPRSLASPAAGPGVGRHHGHGDRLRVHRGDLGVVRRPPRPRASPSCPTRSSPLWLALPGQPVSADVTVMLDGWGPRPRPVAPTSSPVGSGPRGHRHRSRLPGPTAGGTTSRYRLRVHRGDLGVVRRPPGHQLHVVSDSQLTAVSPAQAAGGVGIS